MGAASLAGRLNAPIVLTAANSLPEVAEQALADANPDNVIITGGMATVSAEVQVAIQQLLPDANVERVAGANRFETANS